MSIDFSAPVVQLPINPLFPKRRRRWAPKSSCTNKRKWRRQLSAERQVVIAGNEGRGKAWINDEKKFHSRNSLSTWVDGPAKSSARGGNGVWMLFNFQGRFRFTLSFPSPEWSTWPWALSFGFDYVGMVEPCWAPSSDEETTTSRLGPECGDDGNVCMCECLIFIMNYAILCLGWAILRRLVPCMTSEIPAGGEFWHMFVWRMYQSIMIHLCCLYVMTFA